MPGSLVEFAARPGNKNRDGACNEVGRAGKHEGDGLVEAKSLDNSREEVLESVGG